MCACSNTSATFSHFTIFDRPALAEPVDQFPPRAMNPGLDRAERDIQHVGNLRVTQLLLVKQEKRPTILGPQVSERQMQFLGQLTASIVIWRVVRDQLFRQLACRPTTPR